ncbi:hypothetical protein Bca52824_002831 [Brassica carinata]|uniref:Uncharacterized protein n=1 Tax=Brassica carinata TaxID=52824 RepID=A0A8X7WK09_BRACI|nr:hypothetical protein Bca52824_002831 [Brassica carinata]
MLLTKRSKLSTFDDPFTRIINPKTYLVICRTAKVIELVATGICKGFDFYVLQISKVHDMSLGYYCFPAVM